MNHKTQTPEKKMQLVLQQVMQLWDGWRMIQHSPAEIQTWNLCMLRCLQIQTWKPCWPVAMGGRLGVATKIVAAMWRTKELQCEQECKAEMDCNANWCWTKECSTDKGRNAERKEAMGGQRRMSEAGVGNLHIVVFVHFQFNCCNSWFHRNRAVSILPPKNAKMIFFFFKIFWRILVRQYGFGPL